MSPLSLSAAWCRAVPAIALLLAACNSSSDDTKAEDESKKSAQAEGADENAGPSKCKQDAVEKLTKALADAQPSFQPMLVAGDLRNACELPPAFDAFFALTVAPKPPSDKDRYEWMVTSLATLDEICDDAEKVRVAAGALPEEDRIKALYEGCDFQRFDLIGADEYLKRRPSNPVPWFAYDWLLKQKVSEEHAKAIALAMIRGDQPRWAAQGQTLATLEHALPPIPDGTRVHITARDLRIGDKVLVMVDEDGDVDPAAKKGHLIGPLYDQLAEAADKAKAEAARDKTEWDGRLVLIADKNARFSTVVDVMYTAGRAEFRSFAMVAEAASEFGAVPIEPPKYSATARGATSSMEGALIVNVLEDGFKLWRDGNPVDGEAGRAHNPLRPTIALAKPGSPLDDVERYDWAALVAKVTAEQTKDPKQTKVVVSAEGSIPAASLIRAMEAVRGEGCGAGGKCLLPDVILAADLPSTIPMMARNFDPELMAEQAGILGKLAAGEDGFLASPYGTLPTSRDDEDVWGGLTGDEVGEAFGVGGLGLVGKGGDGTGEGTIGLGNTGLIGKGGEGGTDYGGGFGGRGKRVPRVRQAKADVDGSLDKDIIRRIIRAHINEVRYCYNQGLAKDPKLEGRVVVDFTINASGKVDAASVKDTTLKDEDVAECIAKAVKRWKFPRPSDGNDVSVSYPFVLSPG